jgi:hypothetical protein
MIARYRRKTDMLRARVSALRCRVNIITRLASINDHEARADGRDAFWHGRPIWTNPLTGDAARAWTDGWKRALANLSHRLERVVPATAAEQADWQSLLALYRPADVTPRPRRRTSRRASVPLSQPPASLDEQSGANG